MLNIKMSIKGGPNVTFSLPGRAARPPCPAVNYATALNRLYNIFVPCRIIKINNHQVQKSMLFAKCWKCFHFFLGWLIVSIY